MFDRPNSSSYTVQFAGVWRDSMGLLGVDPYGTCRTNDPLVSGIALELFDVCS